VKCPLLAPHCIGQIYTEDELSIWEELAIKGGIIQLPETVKSSRYRSGKDELETFSIDPLAQPLLQQLEKTFVLHVILVNAEHSLECGDSKLKEDFLGFREEILAQCSHIKLLLITI